MSRVGFSEKSYDSKYKRDQYSCFDGLAIHLKCRSRRYDRFNVNFSTRENGEIYIRIQ